MGTGRESPPMAHSIPDSLLNPLPDSYLISQGSPRRAPELPEHRTVTTGHWGIRGWESVTKCPQVGSEVPLFPSSTWAHLGQGAPGDSSMGQGSPRRV